MPKKEFLEGKQQITLYPTKAQHKKLKELAIKRGKNLSTYILDSAFRDEKIHEKLDRIIKMLDGEPLCSTPFPVTQNNADKMKNVSESKPNILEPKGCLKPGTKQMVKSFMKGGNGK
jgi:hypothetical protein